MVILAWAVIYPEDVKGRTAVFAEEIAEHTRLSVHGAQPTEIRSCKEYGYD